MCDVVKELNARLRVRAKLLSVLTSDKVEWFWEAENGKRIEWRDE